MKIKITDIEMDETIQCREKLSKSVLKEYAEKMSAGGVMEPVVLFGNPGGRYYIGDGWHRITAAKQINREEIEANVTEGGRIDALKHALGANSKHGLRRSNADKRKAVAVAIREFGDMSDNALAGMTGVTNHMVAGIRKKLPFGTNPNAFRKTSDGRSYPAKRKPKKKTKNKGGEETGETVHTPKEERFDDIPFDYKGYRKPRTMPQGEEDPVAASDALIFAAMAIAQLRTIHKDDPLRAEAFDKVHAWIHKYQ